MRRQQAFTNRAICWHFLSRYGLIGRSEAEITGDSRDDGDLPRWRQDGRSGNKRARTIRAILSFLATRV
jgi:hypothetical protein